MPFVDEYYLRHIMYHVYPGSQIGHLNYMWEGHPPAGVFRRVRWNIVLCKKITVFNIFSDKGVTHLKTPDPCATFLGTILTTS